MMLTWGTVPSDQMTNGGLVHDPIVQLGIQDHLHCIAFWRVEIEVCGCLESTKRVWLQYYQLTLVTFHFSNPNS